MTKSDIIIKIFDGIIYWTIILIPFSMAIAPAPMNILMGFLIAAFIFSKILKKEGIFPGTAIELPILSLFVVTCISILHSINLADSFRGGIGRLAQYAFVFFALSAQLRDKRQIKRIIFSIILGLLLVSIDGFWQVFTGKDFIRGFEPMVLRDMVRATASFKDPNTFGVYLSALSPLVLGLALYYQKGLIKILFILTSIIVLAGIALTYSRPTLLAVYIVLFCFSLIKKDRLLLVLLTVFIFLAPFIAPKTVKDWAREVEYNPLRFMCNDDRIAIYLHSLNMIRDHPVIGLGANTYMKNYKRYKNYPEYRNVITADFLYAHNNFLHMAAEIGLLGLGIFLWLIYELFRECIAVNKKLKDDFFKILSLSLNLCLLAFLVNGLTESSLYSSRVALIFWYLMGLAIGMKKFANTNV